MIATPRRPAALVLALTLLVGGCAGSATWYSQRIDETFEEARANNAKMANLRLGQKREEVLQVMGPPARSEGGVGAARVGERRAYFAPGGFVATSIYDRARLPLGSRVSGPAIVEQADTTTVIPPGWQGQVDGFGHLLLESAQP